MTPPRLFGLFAVSLILALACGADQPAADGPRTPKEPAAQDTGVPGAKAQAEVQAVVAQAQAQADAEREAQQQAQAEAANTEACSPRAPAPREGPGCITSRISCDDRIQGTTVGGSQHFDGDRYLHSYCFPTTAESHRGPERVYAFELRAGQRASFELSSPCADLDLAVLRWEGTGCPPATAGITECEGKNRGGGGTASVWNNRDAHYLVVVDGSADQGANFELSVRCVDSEI
jgi:hypothetical protein